MAVEWVKAPDEVIELARELIDKWHPHLQDARIGLIFRSEARVSHGREILGEASKVTARWRPLLKQDLDFVIWLAVDWWRGNLDAQQRRALLDHELCHCVVGEGGGFSLRGHDIEEFNDIILRHGDWLPERIETRIAFEASQLSLLGDRVTAERTPTGALISIELPEKKRERATAS